MKNLKTIIGLAAVIGLVGSSYAGATMLTTNTSTVDSSSMGLQVPGGDTLVTLMAKFAQDSSGGADYTPAGGRLVYEANGAIGGATTTVDISTGALTNNPTGCVNSVPDDGLVQDLNLSVTTSAGSGLGCGYHSVSAQTAPGGDQTLTGNTATGSITSTLPFSVSVGDASTDNYLSITGVNSVTMDPQGQLVSGSVAAGDAVFASNVTVLDNSLTQVMNIPTEMSAGPPVVTAAGNQTFVIGSTLTAAFNASLNSDSQVTGDAKFFDFTMDIAQQIEVADPIDRAFGIGDTFTYDLADPSGFTVSGGSPTLPSTAGSSTPPGYIIVP